MFADLIFNIELLYNVVFSFFVLNVSNTYILHRYARKYKNCSRDGKKSLDNDHALGKFNWVITVLII